MPPRSRALELNEALSKLGFGKFQCVMFALLFPVTIFHGARMTSGYFFLMEESHRCALPGWTNNDTYNVKPGSSQQLDYNMSIPHGDSCHVWDGNFSYDHNNIPEINASDSRKGSCPNGWVYNTDILSRNAITKFSLVCDRTDLQTLGAMLLYLGSLIGATLLGAVSDRYGRKACLMLSLAIFIPCGVGLPWVQHFATFGVLQFLLGGASTGMFASAFVMGLELVQAKARKYPGLIVQMFFTLGEFLLAASFFGLRDWRWVSLVITAPAAIFISYYWFVPESLRWLMLHKKYDQVSTVLDKMSKFNGVGTVKPEDELDKDLEDLLKSFEAEEGQINKAKKKDSFLDLFKSWCLSRRTMTIFINWIVVNMIFYGFTLNSANLKTGDKYETFCISAAVEIPANLTSLVLVDRIGRKPVHCCFLLIAAVTSIGAVGVALGCDEEHQWIVGLLSMIAKYGASGLMGTSFLWMTELFPTSVRSTGLGVASSCARAGAIVAPYIVHYGKKMTPHQLGSAMPFMVFGVASLLAFLINLGLPETYGKPALETVEDAKNIGKESKPETVSIQGDQPNLLNYGSIDNH